MKTTQEKLKDLALLVEADLREIYGEDMGFFIVASPLNPSSSNKGQSDYIANCHRESVVSLMDQLSLRLKNSLNKQQNNLH